MKLPAALLLLSVLPIVSCTTEFGSTKVTRTIDPDLPREDPTGYPDNPVVSIPPVVACPLKSTNACPVDRDAGSADTSGDTPTESDASSDRDDPEASVEDASPPNDAEPDAGSADKSNDDPG